MLGVEALVKQVFAARGNNSYTFTNEYVFAKLHSCALMLANLICSATSENTRIIVLHKLSTSSLSV